MKKKRWMAPAIVGGGIAVIVAVIVVLYVSGGKSDQELAGELTGTWEAVDTANAALHKFKEPVDREEVTVQPDGILLYTVVQKGAAEPSTDRWGWSVRKSHLLLQYRGEDGADAGTLRVRFTVSGDRLSLIRKGFPEKEFVRKKL